MLTIGVAFCVVLAWFVCIAITVYGGYFEFSTIRRWLDRNNVCPISKKPLLPHMVRFLNQPIAIRNLHYQHQ
jgi:hypothetical protein